jgi:hypothetical protein
MLRLVCEKCGRSGQLLADKLTEYGRDHMLPRLKIRPGAGLLAYGSEGFAAVYRQ